MNYVVYCLPAVNQRSEELIVPALCIASCTENPMPGEGTFPKFIFRKQQEKKMDSIKAGNIGTENEVSMYDQKSGLSSFGLNFETGS